VAIVLTLARRDAQDGDVYIVRQDVESDAWTLTMFERGNQNG
jgi:hypothetical protein